MAPKGYNVNRFRIAQKNASAEATGSILAILASEMGMLFFHNDSNRRNHQPVASSTWQVSAAWGFSSGWAGDTKLPKPERKRFAKNALSQDVSRCRLKRQDRLYAADRGRSSSSSKPWMPRVKTARSST